MVIRYGKDCDMRKINRNLSAIKEMIRASREHSLAFWSEELEEAPHCRICGSADRDPFLKVNGKFDYYECKNCGMLYLAQVPECKDMYESNGDKANGDIYIDESIWLERVDMIARPKVDFILEVCEAENLFPKSWMDIGSGGGEILYYISQHKRLDCEGIEADGRESDFAKAKGLRVISTFLDFENTDKDLVREIQSKDVVSLFNVLEHVDAPAKMIDCLANIMKKDSVLAIEVPRHPSAASFANLTGSDKIYRHIHAPGHISIFSEKSMDHLLGGKFRMIGKWGFGQGFTDIVNNAMLASNTPENELYLDVLSCSNSIQKVFDEAGLSDTMIYVAVKI